MTTGTPLDLSARAASAGGSPTLHGYLAVPDGDGPRPGVVLVHEAFGLDAEMRGHADRLARMGFLTLAPDLYSAGGARRCLVGTFRALGTGKGRAFADIEAARTELASRSDCTGRVGVIGFCMGGGFALLTATKGFDASAVNYGMLLRDLDAAVAGACPIVASYGAGDFSLRGAAGRLEAALTRADVPHDVVEYPGASHSFLNEGDNAPALLRPVVKIAGFGPAPEASAHAWTRIERFLTTHLT
ncbi:dienelactone hydrolase family protein [Pseudonocardia pini]|uniref:dienelactone hydrolase family protein n=1 Tax=Pseudonocardia pini TaxID=2758030 RepID=UPI0028A7206B|nr:dienelactone hydrolase family protein [Pseudonocardia pini]